VFSPRGIILAAELKLKMYRCNSATAANRQPISVFIDHFIPSKEIKIISSPTCYVFSALQIAAINSSCSVKNLIPALCWQRRHFKLDLHKKVRQSGYARNR
jgi:hypothetical protein